MKAIPVLDGLRQWRTRPPPTGTRMSVLEATPSAVAKAITQSRSLAYRSIETASAVMWAGSRKSTRADQPPRNCSAPPLGPGADPFQDQLDRIGRRQRDQGLGPRLLEAEHEVAQDVQDRDRDGESPQRGEATGRSR